MKTKIVLKEALKAVSAASIVILALVAFGPKIASVQAAARIKTMKSVKAGGITTPYLANDAVTAEKILEGAVGWSEIASDAVGADEISDGAVGSGEISDGAVSGADLANNSVTSEKISDGAVSSADIGDGVVANGDISSSAAIAYSKLNLGSNITSSNISDGTITNADVNSSAAISYSKLNLADSITSSDITNGTITGTDISSSAQLSVATNETINGIDVSSGAVSDVTQLDVDNIRINGNTVSATNDSGLYLYDNASEGIHIYDGGAVYMSDDVDISDHLAVGSSASTYSSMLVNVSETFISDSSSNYGLHATPTFDYSLTASQHDYGAYVSATASTITEGAYDYYLRGISGTATVSAESSASSVDGVYGEVYLLNDSEKTVNYAFGARGNVFAFGSGAVDDAIGVYGSASSQGSSSNISRANGVYGYVYEYLGTVSTGYALRAECNDATTCYGLYVDSGDSDVTTDWGIVENGADKNYFSADVGMGAATSPLSRLHVRDDEVGNYIARFANDGGGSTNYGIMVQSGADAGSGNLVQFFDGDGSDVGEITFSGTTTTYGTSSDERMKKNIRDTRRGLADLMDMKIRDFEFKNNSDEHIYTGFIAQEIYNIFPEAVYAPSDGMWSVDYGKVTPLIIRAVQEQQSMISDQGSKIDDQGLRITGQSGSINDLQTAVNVSLDDIDASLDEHAGKISKLSASVSDFENSLSGIELAVSALENRIEVVEASVNGEIPEENLELESGVLPENIIQLDEKGNAKIAGVMSAKGVIAEGFSSEKIETGEITVLLEDEGQATIGEEKISKGEDKSSVVKTSAVDDKANIFVTFSDNPGAIWWVEKEKDGDSKYVGFSVHLAEPAEEDADFSWWILKKK